ncbi:phage holin family protein [Cohnella hashimotonis]|uniref:Phage holin family protein n=1 Tax=Cohnella hashimotonis TaxID=2826895 RepID=A0ABT6TIY6_9BACL|nr:phage holin family protein [Cohnella hashimotonis]MDI4646785.1 phage holin family protein [Cohnella hashimotonis]
MSWEMNCAVAVAGSVLTFAFGLWNEALTLLVVAMGVDYVTGVYAAIRSGPGLNSRTGFRGLAKKGMVLLVLLVCHRIDQLLGVNAVMGGATYFYLANELISVVENCGRLGLPLPERLKQTVQMLKDKSKDKELKSKDDDLKS